MIQECCQALQLLCKLVYPWKSVSEIQFNEEHVSVACATQAQRLADTYPSEIQQMQAHMQA